MGHKRNTQGLIENAKKKRLRTIEKTEKAIDKLLKEKKNVNFIAVSKAANVSKSWLYKEKLIANRIVNIRDRQQSIQAAIPKKSQNASADSKKAIIRALKERIKKLEGENRELKNQRNYSAKKLKK